MEKLSNTEAELKERVTYKKMRIHYFHLEELGDQSQPNIVAQSVAMFGPRISDCDVEPQITSTDAFYSIIL